MIAAVVILVRRRHAATAAARRILDPVLVSGAVTLVFVAVSLRPRAGLEDGEQLAFFVGLVAFVSVPYFFLAGLLRFRLARSAAGELLQEVSETPTIEEAQDGLRRALHDPTLELAWWVPESGGYVDQEGHPFTPGGGARPRDDARRARGPTARGRRPRRRAAGRARAAERRPRRRQARARQGPAPGRAPRAGWSSWSASATTSRVLVNAAPTFFCVIDLEGRIVRFNDTLIAASGTPDDEAVRGTAVLGGLRRRRGRGGRRSRVPLGGAGRARAPVAGRPAASRSSSPGR